MSKRNKFARVILMVIPVILVLGFVNVSQGWTPANLQDQTYFGETAGAYDKEILVGAYYFAGGWHSDTQIFHNNVRMTGDAYNTAKMYWDYIHNGTQATWDADGFNISSGGLTHTFKKIDWEVKYLFDANQATMPAGYNYWTNVQRGARFQQYYGHQYDWDEDMLLNHPLSTTDGYLGYYDCDDPDVWEEQIDAAADHGVDFFAYEMFWNYDGGIEKKSPPTPIDDGFLAATNRNKMRLAFAWINHTWVIGTQNYSQTALEKFVDFLDTYYFQQSNYLKIDGKPVVYIYNIDKADGGFMRITSGNNRTAAQVNALLTIMRNRATYHGYDGLYIVGMGNPSGSNGNYSGCGFDAITNYNHSSWTQDEDYDDYATNVVSRWTTYANAVSEPFQPVVSASTYKGIWTGGSYTNTGMKILNEYGMSGGETPSRIIASTGTNPANYKDVLESAKTFVNGRNDTDRIIMLNAWNEWGEGCAIEPTQQHGFGYLEAIRDECGRNVLANWGLESGTTSWSFWCPGSGSFTALNNAATSEWTGLKHGRIYGATAAYTFAHQRINSGFTPGRAYTAWVKVKTTNVAGNGARLRIDCRNSSNGIIAVHESDPLTGSSGDFQILSILGQTIPANTHHISVEVCGSTNQGCGSTSSIEFDDVVFKPTTAISNSWPTATISASDNRITGSGSTNIVWSTTNCANAQVYYRTNNSDSETYWRAGTSGTQSFSGTAGNVYTFNIYEGTGHTRLLNSCTVVCHPTKPSGYTVDDYEDGSITNTWFAGIAGQTESDGVLSFYTTNTSPTIVKHAGISINAATYDQVKIRMKVIHGATNGKIYWNTGSGLSEALSQTFTINNDGQWHEYVIDLSSHGYWTGTVSQFRLNPGYAMGALIEIDYMVVSP